MHLLLLASQFTAISTITSVKSPCPAQLWLSSLLICQFLFGLSETTFPHPTTSNCFEIQGRHYHTFIYHNKSTLASKIPTNIITLINHKAHNQLDQHRGHSLASWSLSLVVEHRRANQKWARAVRRNRDIRDHSGPLQKGGRKLAWVYSWVEEDSRPSLLITQHQQPVRCPSSQCLNQSAVLKRSPFNVHDVQLSAVYLGLVKEDIIKYLATELDVPDCWTEDERKPNDSAHTGIEDTGYYMAGSPGLTGRPAHDKIIGFIQKAKDEGGDVLIGGAGGDSKGYFIQPIIILTKDPE
ncbi:hypothetical protein EV424DRAFT_1353545 [Suillus variegatus]|nr:hypothetical protein EV424DRAFT_1353545 [Suillus variegatus]